MDILTPHDGLTNEKICKAQIEAVEKKQNEYKLIGRLTKVSGHTLYKFNTTTREASKAIVEVRSGYCYDPEKGSNMQIKHRFNVKVEKDCYYEQALNMKNFIKRLRRRGIIGADENVKIVKMIKFKRTASTGGDETAPYDVIFDRQYTVREFIDYVLTRREWGYIYFKGGPHCEYRGSLLLSAIPDEYMEAGIESVKAAGGWFRMDYRIEINK